MKPRILTLDIETAPLEAYTWGIWQQDVALNQIKADWSILSFSAKWLDGSKVIYGDTGGRGADQVRDDSDLLKKLWALLDEADIVVTQNGKAFDIKRINARLILNGFEPYSPIKIIDTKVEAKKAFAFVSNRLEYLSAQLTETPKDSHKRFPGFALWVACLKDDPAAWREMKRYNGIDVLATERLFLKLRPWMTKHPNVAVHDEREAPACPKCGSEDLEKRGYATSQAGKYHRYKCRKCSGWAQGRANLLSKAARKALVGN